MSNEAAVTAADIARLAGHVETLVAQGDPEGLYVFFGHLVEQSAAHRTIVDLLEVDLQVGP
ncbi:hypothetical protein ACFQ1S_39890, partial [Kibdelosporangium lantanae]